MTESINVLMLAGLASLSVLSSGCGSDLLRQSRAPMMLVISNLTASSGATGESGLSFLNSDVTTGGGVINDSGSATLTLVAKDPTGPAATALNSVTITQYRVKFIRSDGQDKPGIDVPYPIDSAVTITVQAGGSADVGFELVRHNAKREPPLVALGSSALKLSMIAEVTFFGRDQAGNQVSATGRIGITFGDFADPT